MRFLFGDVKFRDRRFLDYIKVRRQTFTNIISKRVKVMPPDATAPGAKQQTFLRDSEL